MIAGAKQWGRAMQDDVTDATRWAVEQKLAVPDRICIVGASYGAYAAMMGLAREPSLYRCGVGYVGVYDLPLMLRGASRTARWARDWSEDWVGRKDEVAAVSPVGMGAAIRAPVLLAAGGRDERAPIEHSKRLEKAVKAAGGSVQTLYYPTEGHGFYTEAHRLEYYRTLLAFLATHLGGAPAAGAAP
jgi:dipeptidyl aminopeptidase/acylaminoacyl peptidase